MHFFFQLFSNDLALNYVNVSVEPFGDLSVSEGVPFNQQHTGIVTVFEYIVNECFCRTFWGSVGVRRCSL